MIKLSRTPKPPELNTAVQRQLTNEFIQDNNKNVWAKPYIRQALLKMSNRKCAYCETLINEEAKYMEVEHFYPKNIYPNSVVEWNNLLPSCKRCNGKKGRYDTGVDPFVHPVVDEPRDHLILCPAARIKGADEKGRATIQKLGLNEYDFSRKPRIKIVNKLMQELDELHDELTNRSLRNNPGFQKKVQRKMFSILQATGPRSAYSAYTACEVVRHPALPFIMEIMKNYSIWNSRHERLFQQAIHNAIPYQS